MATSFSGRYQVFVSHAGEDKHTIAVPLREKLRERGITAFVDEKDISPGGKAADEMTTAMENAEVAVIVLSPEFVAKKWPMKELLFFLNRREEAHVAGELGPTILPVFYRLSVAEMYNEPQLERKGADGRSLYATTRFFERRDNEEPEADIDIIQKALRTIHGIMGMDNKYQATNEASSMPSRLRLLNDLCEMISQALLLRTMRNTPNEGTPSVSDTPNESQRSYHDESLPRENNAVRDFMADDTVRQLISEEEEEIKYCILRSESFLHSEVCSLPLRINPLRERTFAITGDAGVGKSTVLKKLASDEDLRRRFCDGIHSISLGRDATVLTLFQELSRALRDSGSSVYPRRAVTILQRATSLELAISEVIYDACSWFRDKNCLFLFDDVWSKEIGKELFSRVVELGGQESTVLFTSYDFDIVCIADRCLHLTPKEVRGIESRKILFYHAGVTEDTTRDGRTSRSLVEILEFCNGLPLSLEVAGKAVKTLVTDTNTEQGDPWIKYLQYLREYHYQRLNEHIYDSDYVYITFGASIAILEEGRKVKLGFRTPLDFWEMYRRLCILRKKAKVPASILRHLWELQDNIEAKVVGMRFVEMGLAESVYELIGTSSVWHFSIHDALHDYATAEAKRYDHVRIGHTVLLEGYSRSQLFLSSYSCESMSRSDCEELYMYENITHHLKEVGDLKTIEELMRHAESMTKQGTSWNGSILIPWVVFFRAQEALSDMRRDSESLVSPTETKTMSYFEMLRLVLANISRFLNRLRRVLVVYWHEMVDRYLRRY